MLDKYFYHYYPLHDINRIEKIKKIETYTISELLSGYHLEHLSQPRRSLYHLSFPIIKNKIWINRIENLNDPFECLGYICPEYLNEMTYELYLKETLNPLSKLERYQQLLERASRYNSLLKFNIFELPPRKHYGIFSLCKKSDDIQMWSYYASNHAGICIRFKVQEDLQNLFASDGRKVHIAKYDPGPMVIFGKVNYDEKPFIIDKQQKHIYEELHAQLLLKNPNLSGWNLSIHDLMVTQIILGKHKNWKNEQELRIIALGLEDNLLLSSIKKPNTNDPYLIPDAIIFGYKTPDFIKKVLKNSVKSRNFEYYYAYIDYGKYKLKILPEK